jgi:transitional endoplasmic reticulum ATPase
LLLGRIDCLIYVPPPDRDGRKGILDKLLSESPLALGTSSYVNHIADVTERFTGADLKNLITEAKLNAAQRISNNPNLPIEVMEFNTCIELIFLIVIHRLPFKTWSMHF